jgi:hypothetical protein
VAQKHKIWNSVPTLVFRDRASVKGCDVRLDDASAVLRVSPAPRGRFAMSDVGPSVPSALPMTAPNPALTLSLLPPSSELIDQIKRIDDRDYFVRGLGLLWYYISVSITVGGIGVMIVVFLVILCLCKDAKQSPM